jgi:hypothetical protein
MSDTWRADADEILRDLQTRVSARDLEALAELFEEPAVLIGTAGEGRTNRARREYLEAVVSQPAELVWEWQEQYLFYESPDALGFAAFGDVVLRGGSSEWRSPIRGSFFAVRSDEGWRLRQFHGSIAQSG